MKKVVLSVMLATCFSFFSCEKNSKNQENGNSQPNTTATNTQNTNNSQEQPKASIKFEVTEYNFGEINEGEKVKYAFKFTNDGKNPLIIQDAKPSCGCTVPTYSKEPVAPGGSGEIIAEFDSNGRPGEVNKTITITANTEPTTTVLYLKGKVKGKNPQMQDLSQMKGPVKQ
ncbi:DUF1573 domain-containing protein [Raineya orbicola]|uniref:DUF1573 domain-containing protein n=1 Tax=Raineya orbicola TaxID=2016530 RepID=A0A2N3IIJ0_9BACT|nr:DUF1573 domain-containing protein [Raineya orbicola]PKQ70152.1 hypothetical protein Rain11_0812 [Raineya orbicola]